MYVFMFILPWSNQWPFQEPKLEVPTIYKAYFSGLCKGIYPQNMAWNMVQYLRFRILEISHWSNDLNDPKGTTTSDNFQGHQGPGWWGPRQQLAPGGGLWLVAGECRTAWGPGRDWRKPRPWADSEILLVLGYFDEICRVICFRCYIYMIIYVCMYDIYICVNIYVYDMQRCTVWIFMHLHVVCVCVGKYIAMLLFFNVHANF